MDLQSPARTADEGTEGSSAFEALRDADGVGRIWRPEPAADESQRGAIARSALPFNPAQFAGRGRQIANQWQAFVMLWAMAFTFHIDDRQPPAWSHGLLFAVTALVVVGGGRPWTFLVFLVGSSLVAASELPAAANHTVLALLTNGALLASGLVAFRRTVAGDEPDDSTPVGRWMATARTPITLTIVVVYFFGLFHKLNTDFLTPSVSCAGVLLGFIPFPGVSFDHFPDAVVYGAAIATLACEAALCALFAVPKWRGSGVVLGVVFHSALAWAGFADFSTFMFALYLLIVPITSGGDDRAGPDDGRQWRVATAFAGWVAYAVVTPLSWVSADPYNSPLGLQWFTVQRLAWCLAAYPLVWPHLRARVSRPSAIVAWRWRPSPAWLVAFLIAAFVNGATPYLGLKTVANYSMFSNLRVEDSKTNHFVPGIEALSVTPWLRDMVNVYEFDIGTGLEAGVSLRERFRIRAQARWLVESRPTRIPWLELRRLVLLAKDRGVHRLRVRYDRGGVVRTIEDATVDTDLSAPLPWWMTHFVAFRAMQSDNGPVACRW